MRAESTVAQALRDTRRRYEELAGGPNYVAVIEVAHAVYRTLEWVLKYDAKYPPAELLERCEERMERLASPVASCETHADEAYVAEMEMED